MSDPVQPQATAIPQTGAPTWQPAAEDDANPLQPSQRQRARDIFFGADGLRAGWSLLLFALLQLLLAVAVNAGMRVVRHGAQPPMPKIMPAAFVIRSHAASFAVIALSAFAVSRVERRRFGRYGIGSLGKRRFGQFITGAGIGLSLLSLLVLALRLSGLLAFDGVLLHGSTAVQYALLWAVAFLGVGFVEEYLMRGFLQFTLTRGLAGLARAAGMRYRPSVVLAFWLSAAFFSVLFGLGHGNNTGESPIGLLAAGLIGFVFAFSLWRTGSLWWAIGFHAAWDWAESYLYGVADSGLLVQNHLLASHPVGRPLLSGGLTGPEGSIYILGIVLLITLIIAVTLPPEPGSYADPNWTPNNSIQR